MAGVFACQAGEGLAGGGALARSAPGRVGGPGGEGPPGSPAAPGPALPIPGGGGSAGGACAGTARGSSCGLSCGLAAGGVLRRRAGPVVGAFPVGS